MSWEAMEGKVAKGRGGWGRREEGKGKMDRERR